MNPQWYQVQFCNLKNILLFLNNNVEQFATHLIVQPAKHLLKFCSTTPYLWNLSSSYIIIFSGSCLSLLITSTCEPFWKAMSTVEERTAYLDNPFFEKHIYGDFTPFYITIAICTIFGVFLFALNLICGCCSKHRYYWNDRFTGLSLERILG